MQTNPVELFVDDRAHIRSALCSFEDDARCQRSGHSSSSLLGGARLLEPELAFVDGHENGVAVGEVALEQL